MTSMLQQSPLSSSSSTSLPSYCDYGEAGTDESPSAPMHDFSVFSSSSDENYPVEVTEFQTNTDYLTQKHKPSACQSWQSFLIRSFFVFTIFGIVSYNLRSTRGGEETRFDEYNTPGENYQPSSAEIQKQIAIEANIQRMSKALMIEKYGRGPHLVEFELNIWESERPMQHFFTIELAPVDLMPATVYYFLEQVSRGLWSWTSFHLNAGHVIAARPVSGNGQISKRQVFENSGFGTIPFNEYNEHYPHLPYTLGIADGPAFYINKRRNWHREACFAEVVIGRSTIDMIAAMRGYDHDPTRIRPVDIVAARRVSIRDFNDKAAKEYLAVKSSR